MRSAIIIDGIVTNIILGQIEGSVPCGDDVSIGWAYDGANFTAPEPEPEPELTPDEMRAEAERKRQAAFQSEADPLFFKWQAGEGTKEDWEAKREEIRQRYPYPNQGE